MNSKKALWRFHSALFDTADNPAGSGAEAPSGAAANNMPVATAAGRQAESVTYLCARSAP